MNGKFRVKVVNLPSNAFQKCDLSNIQRIFVLNSQLVEVGVDHVAGPMRRRRHPFRGCANVIDIIAVILKALEVDVDRKEEKRIANCQLVFVEKKFADARVRESRCTTSTPWSSTTSDHDSDKTAVMISVSTHLQNAVYMLTFSLGIFYFQPERRGVCA